MEKIKAKKSVIDILFMKKEIKKTHYFLFLKFTATVASVVFFYFVMSLVPCYNLDNTGKQKFFNSDWQNIAMASDGENTRQFSSTMPASEHFVAKEIFFGGDALLTVGNNEKVAPEIFDIKSESFLLKNKRDSQLVVSWKTNKLTKGEFEYAKNGSDDMKVIKETDYGFTHSIIISNLEPGTPYVYKIKAIDRWGNFSISNSFAIYSGSKEVSIFEFILKELEKIFGWAIK